MLLHFPPLHFGPAFSSTAFSTLPFRSRIFQSWIFYPCILVPHSPVLHFPPLHFGPSRTFQSRIFSVPHGGTLCRRTANKNLIYWAPRKRSPKRLIVLVEPKNGGTIQKKFPSILPPPIFAPDWCPPLFRHHLAGQWRLRACNLYVWFRCN